LWRYHSLQTLLNAKTISIDMYAPYIEVIKRLFPKAKIIIVSSTLFVKEPIKDRKKNRFVVKVMKASS
jgi:hypothetical protein